MTKEMIIQEMINDINGSVGSTDCYNQEKRAFIFESESVYGLTRVESKVTFDFSHIYDVGIVKLIVNYNDYVNDMVSRINKHFGP